jgi:Uri superfamily endonuclease
LKGTYVLILACMKPFRVKIGSLGYANIGKGCYIYTGSALGTGAISLEGRLRRHSQRAKKVKWHVDYLTSDVRCKVKAAVVVRSRKRLECAVNRAILGKLNARPVLPGAGSSDCKCEGHLAKAGLTIRSSKILPMVVEVCRRFDRSVSCMQFTNSAEEKRELS